MPAHPVYFVDAFTDRVFHGNPAAVVLISATLPEPIMLAVAREHNLPMTAFVTPLDNTARRNIRWFHTQGESLFCGHATLAAAHVLFNELNTPDPTIVFNSPAGPIAANAAPDSRVALDLPVTNTAPTGTPPALAAIFNAEIVETHRARDLLVVLDCERSVRAAAPSAAGLAAIDARGVIITAPADDAGIDFVSRFFSCSSPLYEDQATGSAHTALAPYWAARLNKRSLRARQLSERTGELWCSIDPQRPDRVTVAGNAVTYATGLINLPAPG